MMTLPTPFQVSVRIPGTSHWVDGLLLCLFYDGEVLVTLEGVPYHCMVNAEQQLELTQKGYQKWTERAPLSGAAKASSTVDPAPTGHASYDTLAPTPQQVPLLPKI